MADSSVTPNKRGARSRQLVLDTAEQLMAERGYDAATIAALVKESGVSLSSIYHYFGSKNGVLLAVMQRGADRFFSSLDLPTSLQGSPIEHLEQCSKILTAALNQHPDFLRLLIVLGLQPLSNDDRDVQEVVSQIRQTARAGLAYQAKLAFQIDNEARALKIANFALVFLDGAFISVNTDQGATLEALLEYMPQAMQALDSQLY